jgi:hypothetical protein
MVNGLAAELAMIVAKRIVDINAGGPVLASITVT